MGRIIRIGVRIKRARGFRGTILESEVGWPGKGDEPH
jgi:hypothetical protein